MTIKEIYEWACENSVENYHVVFDRTRHMGEKNYEVEIDKENKTIVF